MSPGSRSPLTRGGQALWAVGTSVRPQGLCSSAVRTSSHLQRMRWAVCLAMGNVSPRTSSLMLTALCPHSEGGQQATPCCAPCHQTSGSSLGSCWCNVQNTQPTVKAILTKIPTLSFIFPVIKKKGGEVLQVKEKKLYLLVPTMKHAFSKIS